MFTVFTREGDRHSDYAVLGDAIDQADMIHGEVKFREVRIEAGHGEDHDTGVVGSIEGTTALVQWDSGVVTPCDVRDIRARRN